MSRRLERLNSLLRQEISDLIAHSLKDPRIPEMVSVTQVSVSPDLATAKAYISVLGTNEERKDALDALSTAAPFFRRELRSRLVIKRVPDLEFEYDDTIERGSHMHEAGIVAHHVLRAGEQVDRLVERRLAGKVAALDRSALLAFLRRAEQHGG